MSPVPNFPLSDIECRSALESSAAGFTIMDAVHDSAGLVEDFRWRYLNSTAALLVGRPAEGLIGRRITELIPKVWDRPGLLQRYAGVLATGITVEFDQDAVVSGSKRWFRIIASRVAGGVAVWFADITELKRSEEQLKRSELYLIEAQRLSHCASWAFDPHSAELVWSPEHFYIFGIHPIKEKLSVEEAVSPIHPEDRTRCRERFTDALENRHEFDEHFRIIWPNREVRYIHSVGLPRLDADGQLVEFIGSAIDTTEQVRESKATRTIQEELARASRVMTLAELTSYIAHEVSQPLAALVSNADAAIRWLARAPESGVEQARMSLQKIVREGHRAGRVIAHIRSLARPDVMDWGPVNLNESILEVARLLQFEMSEGRITLHTAFDSDLRPVIGDRIQLQHMLLNLLRNAMEATAGQSIREIVVNTTVEGERAHLRITDSGVGVEPRLLTRIFEPFYTTKSEGMGIGLSLSRTVVEAHFGRIWAECNESGPGATLHCELPLPKPASPSGAIPPKA